MTMLVVLAFAGAAASGALARAVLGRRLNRPASLPWGTLAVNVTGSLALGALAGVAPPAATIAGVAFLGSYTTFSSFARDLAALIEDRRLPAAVSYVVLSVVGCVVAALAGLSIH